jgi:predicted nuclease of restriction endonuclease-like (RecB) superfamily
MKSAHVLAACMENPLPREFYTQMFRIERWSTLTLHINMGNTVNTDAHRMGPGEE